MTEAATARLHRVAEALRASAVVPTTDAAPIAEGLSRWLSGEVPDLATALGVRGAPGQRAPRTAAAMAERDRLVREAAATFFPGQTTTAQAAGIASKIRRYETAGWLRERGEQRCPSRHVGKIEASLWEIMRATGGGLGERRIRYVLSASNCGENSQAVAVVDE